MADPIGREGMTAGGLPGVATVVFGAKAVSGWGIRVRSLLSMLATFSDVKVVHTEKEPGTDSYWPSENRERYSFHNLSAPESFRSRLSRLMNYYRWDRGAVPEREARKAASGCSAVQVEALDLLFLADRLASGKLPIVLDMHDIHWEQIQYSIYDSPAFKSRIGRSRSFRRIAGPLMMRRASRFEADAILKADQVLVTSQVDANKVRSRVPQAEGKLWVVPNCIDVRTYIPSFDYTAGGRRNVVFVGKLSYAPNLDAVEYICRLLAPAFDDGTEFLIVGAPAPTLERIPANVRFLGFVPDVHSVISNADACIVPLRYGTGTRIKILEYMALGRPVVSTEKGAEGLEVKSGRDILLAEGDEGFVRSLKELLADESLARRIGTTGRRTVEERYDWRTHSPALKSVYSALDLVQ